MNPSSPLGPTPTPLPTPSSGPGLSGFSPPPRRKSTFGPIIIAALAFFSVLFFGLFIFAASRWTSAKSDLTVQKQAAYALGKQDQAAAQDQQVREQIETPFRTYTAPTVYGEFVVKYPKNWNAAANEEPSGSLDNLILDSNTIKLNGQTNPYATQIILSSAAYKNADEAYASLVKSKKLKVQQVTVSGITGNRYEGTMPDKRTGVVVILPVRDKTMTIATYDKGYAKEYEQILAQIKIIP